MNLKSLYTSNNKTLKMLIGLVTKWNDKSYDLTDEEWNTIKSYKTVLDMHFNQIESMQETINLNEELILKLK